MGGAPIPDHELDALAARHAGAVEAAQAREAGALSHFEIVTALAFKHFQEQQVGGCARWRLWQLVPRACWGLRWGAGLATVHIAARNPPSCLPHICRWMQR